MCKQTFLKPKSDSGNLFFFSKKEVILLRTRLHVNDTSIVSHFVVVLDVEILCPGLSDRPAI